MTSSAKQACVNPQMGEQFGEKKPVCALEDGTITSSQKQSCVFYRLCYRKYQKEK